MERKIVQKEVESESIQTNQYQKLELNGFLKVLFVLWMCYGGISSIVSFISIIMLGTSEYIFLGTIAFILSLVGIVAFYGMLSQKRWGIILCGIYYASQFLFCVIAGQMDESFANEIIKVLLKFFVLCAVLFISNEGHSAWETIWNEGKLIPQANDTTKTDSELKGGKYKKEEAIASTVPSFLNESCSLIANPKMTSMDATKRVEPIENLPNESVKEMTEYVLLDKSKKDENKRLLKHSIIFLIWGVITSVVIGLCSFWVHNYYTNTYVPQKLLDEACADLEIKWEKATEAEKKAIGIKILSKNVFWGYDKVPNSQISLKFAVPKRKQVFKMFEDDAFRGNPQSQYQMGQFYGISDRYHVVLNYTKAAYWWREAALNGHMGAMCNLGWAYENGQGVKKNMRKAVECYQIAAEGNDAHAMYKLGWCYKNGVKVASGFHYNQYRIYSEYPKYSGDIFVRSGWEDGDHYNVYKHKETDYEVILPKDVAKVRELWKKAATLGHEDAKNDLQRIIE